MKVKRVQKYVETLDMLKLKNTTPIGSGNVASSVRSHKPRQASRFAYEQVSSGGGGGERDLVGQATDQQQQQDSAQASRQSSSSGSVVITTQWETFDSAVPVQPSTSSSSTASAQPRFNWDLL